jgi:hypothetical protein
LSRFGWIPIMIVGRADGEFRVGMRRGVPWRETWCVYLTLNPVLARTLIYSNMTCHREIAPNETGSTWLQYMHILVHTCTCHVRSQRPSWFSWFR